MTPSRETGAGDNRPLQVSLDRVNEAIAEGDAARELLVQSLVRLTPMERASVLLAHRGRLTVSDVARLMDGLQSRKKRIKLLAAALLISALSLLAGYHLGTGISLVDPPLQDNKCENTL